MKAVTTRQKRSGISQRFATLCLGLLMVPILSGVVLSGSPGFFSVNTETSLDANAEQAQWMTASSCSGTCFNGPVKLTSQTVPVQSAQNHLGQYAVAYGFTAEQEQSSTSSVDRRVTEQPQPAKVASQVVPQVNSAQNRLKQFGATSAPTAQRQIQARPHEATATRPAPQADSVQDDYTAKSIPPARQPVHAPTRQAATSRSVPQVNSAQNYFGHFYGTPQVTLETPPQVAMASRVPHRKAPQRSIYDVNSAQTPFTQAALGYQTTVRLVQNVDELQPVDANLNQGAGGESVSEAESLGSAPENVGIQFLRTQTVLLKPHQWQFDVGLEYIIAEADLPVAVFDGGGAVIDVTEARFRQRLLVCPFEVRYGLTSRIQLFTTAPVGYSNTEVTRVGFDDQYSDTGGIGDISFGLSSQLVPGTSCRPELVGTFAVTAPTGDASLGGSLLTPDAVLGEGFWGFTGSLLWVRNYDPVVVFYGLGANFRLDAELDGVDVDPGERFFYQLGVGFAVNRHVTLSTAFIGSYWVEDRWEGVRIPGGIREPLRLRFAATIGKSCRLVEPFAEIGMTEDAPSSRIGITWTF